MLCRHHEVVSSFHTGVPPAQSAAQSDDLLSMGEKDFRAGGDGP